MTRQTIVDENCVSEETEVETALLGNTGTEQNGHDGTSENVTKLVTSNQDNDKPEEEKKIGFRYILHNVRTNNLYRQKIIHTVILWWSFIGLGWTAGMSGPTFPDLRQIINQDLAIASWMFPAGSFGYLVGSFFGGFLYDRFDKIILLFLSTLALGASTILTPYCATLPWMLFIKFAGGTSCGVLDVGGNSHILFLWGQDGNSYMQAIHFGFSLGASVSPYVTEPFLAKKITSCNQFTNTTTESFTTNSLNSTYNNKAVAIFENQIHNASAEVLNHETKCIEEYEPTSVYTAFLISGLVILTSTFAFACLYAYSRRNKTTKEAHIEDKKQNEANTHRKQLTQRMKVFYLILLSVLFSSYCIVEDGFASLLMTFAIERLKWEKSTGSFVTGLFWISFGVGRFFGIFIVACCRTKLLLTSYLTMLGCGYVGFLFSALFNVFPLILIFTVILGFSMSVIFPAIFSWTSENIIEVTGKISSLFMTSASSSGMLCMFLIGNLMDKYDPMWFVYILVIVMGICLLSYTVLSVTLRINCTSKRDDNEITVETNHEHGGTEMDHT